MSSPLKTKHYWTQLTAALAAGNWASQFPAKAPNGTVLSWPELFRKFNKHCPGHADIAEIASHTQALGLIIILEGSGTELGNTCKVPSEHAEDVKKRYGHLKKLNEPDSVQHSIHLLLGYYAYALGFPFECFEHIDKVSDICDLDRTIPIPRTGSLLEGAPHTASSFISSSDAASAITQASDSIKAWPMAEAIRSICLQGMAQEQLSSEEPQVALSCYRKAFPLLSDLATTTLTPSSNSFTRNHELYRWVVLLIWRAIVLSARTTDVRVPNSELWTWISHYSSCITPQCPGDFQTEERSTILSLTLRAFSLRASPSHNDSANARAMIHEYRAILTASTVFPRAGTRNVRVEDFTDLCVAVWESSGGESSGSCGWALDVLWWATRLTFNSHRVLRHLIRVLHISGDVQLAHRVAKLYVQIVGKAWEAANSSSPNEGDQGSPAVITTGPNAEMDSNKRWVETLVAGARMICASSTTCGLAAVREAGEWLEKAKTRLDRDDKELVATVHLAQGIWSAVLAVVEQDPQTRVERFTHSHNLLLLAAETFPASSSSAHHHLSLSFARAGLETHDLEQAILHAGKAIEAHPKEIRSWHLLGLLLARTEKWEEALEALDRGAEIGEEVEKGLEVTVLHGHENGNAHATDEGLIVNGTHARDFAASDTIKATQIDGLPRERSEENGADSSLPLEGPPIFVLDADANDIPPSEGLLQPVRDHRLSSREDILEYALQLRMSEAAVIEYVEGAEGAVDKWVEVFSWIAEKRGKVSEHRRSLDGGRASVKLTSSSGHAPSLSQVQEDVGQDVLHPEPVQLAPDEQVFPKSAIPITVSPATPDGDRTSFDHRASGDFSLTNGSDRPRHSSSTTRDSTSSASKSKKVQQMLKDQVHRSGATISTISKKIGHGVVRNGSLRRSNSTPDFHAVLHHRSYQASSIHSRKRVSSIMRSPNESVTASPPPPPTLPATQQKLNRRTARENRLLSDLWLMSSATFRRLGKIEQAKGAIQEAEVKDETNPAVWVQLGLYHAALGQDQQAIDSLNKALFIAPDDVSASVHLCRLYLDGAAHSVSGDAATSTPLLDPGNVDLAAGLLSQLTRGPGWDIPEAWYYLAKAYAMQNRQTRQRECLSLALELAEKRGVREIGAAVALCL